MTRPKKRRLRADQAIILEIAKKHGTTISFEKAKELAHARGSGLGGPLWKWALAEVGKRLRASEKVGEAAIVVSEKASNASSGEDPEVKLLRVLHEMRVVELHYVDQALDILQWRKVRLA